MSDEREDSMFDSEKRPLGQLVEASRRSARLTQQQLAEKVGFNRATIVNIEKGSGSTEPISAIRLANALNASPREFVLASLLQRPSGKNDDLSDWQTLQKTVQSILKQGQLETPPSAWPDYLTLMDFPGEFAPMKIVVGDKREEDPKTTGDLLAFSASPVDDRWLNMLGLPRDAEKISDKVVMTADQAWMKTTFGRTNILCIGSPATNLFVREYHNIFLFRFAIGREISKSWQDKKKELGQCKTQADLQAFRQKWRLDLKHMMRLFRQPGFVDFNYSHIKLGIELQENRDFAVVSIGRNPFADPGTHFYSILVGGVHHPGTAHAVRFLADSRNFKDHPFGGVLEIQVPSDKHNREEVRWHEIVEKSCAGWHSVGSNALEYSPEKLLENLKKWEPTIAESPVDAHITPTEIREHVALIVQLSEVGRCRRTTESDAQ